MRKLLGLVAAAAFAIGVAAPASAAVVGFTGTLGITVGTLPAIPAFGSGFATVNFSGGGHPITHVQLPGGAFATSITAPVPNAFPIVQLVVNAANAPISLSGGGCTAGHPYVVCPGAGLNGFGGLSGTALVGIFFTTTHTAGSVINTGTNPAANLVVPLAVVGGGSTVQTMGLGISVTVSGAGWTTGAASIINPTATVMVVVGHNPGIPAMALSDDIVVTQVGTTQIIAGTRNTFGTSNFGTESLTLVSPVQIFNTATGAFIPSLASISLHFVPEPGTLLLLGSGVVGLALYGRRRMRK